MAVDTVIFEISGNVITSELAESSETDWPLSVAVFF